MNDVKRISLKDFLKRKWVRRFLVAFWIVYPACYLSLTVNGDYYGPHRYPVLNKPDGSWAMRQQYIWHPFHARLDRFGFNWSGAIFSPLILVDRLVWHRDKIITLDDSVPQQ